MPVISESKAVHFLIIMVAASFLSLSNVYKLISLRTFHVALLMSNIELHSHL